MGPEPNEQSPDPEPDAADYARPTGRFAKLAASSPAQARRWMRWGWLAALAWWVWNTGLLLVWIVASVIPPEAGADPQTDPPFPARIIIYHGVEGFVVGLLGLGLNMRWRPAGMLLAPIFAITRIIALTRLEPLALDARAIWVLVYLGLLFLFIRGAQGVWSYHWFTRSGPTGS